MSADVTVNNKYKLAWREDLTIDDILKELNFSFKMLVVKINGGLVKRNEYNRFKIPAGADVKVIHLMSGG